MSAGTKAIIYAAKSTEDKRGSFPTQLEDCRKFSVHSDWEVVGEYQDEAASAWKGNRGPGLEAAMEHAARVAPSVLVVQHSDRLARGDARQARHLVEVVTWAVRANVTIRSVQDDLFADPRLGVLMGAIMGMRNTEDSERKSKAVKSGLQRRKDRGDPVGPVPLGYTVESGTRVIDPATKVTVERIFDLVESGKTFGDGARALNSEGVTTGRGKPWTSRTVRKIVHNGAYAGTKGYPAIIDPDRFDSIQAALKRLDPAAVAKRRGGRKPVDDSFFLRGLLFCLKCGAPMYIRSQWGRSYVCREVRQCTGLCDAPPIPAEFAEAHVLAHLDSFIGSVEGWLREQVARRSDERSEHERSLVRQRAKLIDLDRLRDRHLAEYRGLVAEGKSTARIALEEVERIDRERADQVHMIQEAEALVEEFSGPPPDADSVLDFYSELSDLINSRIQKCESAAELNRTLRQVLAGLWAEFDDYSLRMKFELLDDRSEPDPSVQTGTQTFV